MLLLSEYVFNLTSSSKVNRSTQIQLLEDKNAHRRQAPIVFEMKTFFGQIKYLLVLHIPVCEAVGVCTPETIVAAAVHLIKPLDISAQGLPKFKALSPGLTVVDLSTVQCLVGRVKEMDNWQSGLFNIINRSGKLSQAERSDAE